MNNIASSRGGAGRGQGRKPISEAGSTAYKLLLTESQRSKLDSLGNAAWIRQQIDFSTQLEVLDMKTAVNLSARYIHALRQLPQFIGQHSDTGALTHLMLGHQIIPLGDLTDENDDSGLLKVVYPGGHSVEVVADVYFQFAIKEAAEIEVCTQPDDLGIKQNKWTFTQARSNQLHEHLCRKHGLRE